MHTDIDDDVLVRIVVIREKNTADHEIISCGIETKCDCPDCTFRNASAVMMSIIQFVADNELDFDKVVATAREVRKASEPTTTKH
jgi:hypothetical protein